MEWRKNLNKEIALYIDDLVKKTNFFPSYKQASKPANAQIWTALGIMAKKLYEQELKIQLFEGVLKEISPKKVEKVQSKEARDKAMSEVERIMKEIAQRKPITIERPKASIVFPKIEKRKKKSSKKELDEIKKKIKSNF